MDFVKDKKRRRKKKSNAPPLCPISLADCDNPAGMSYKSCYYCGRFDEKQLNRALASTDSGEVRQ